MAAVYTKKKAQNARAMYEKGIPVKQIAKKYKVSTACIYLWMEKAGVTLFNKRGAKCGSKFGKLTQAIREVLNTQPQVEYDACMKQIAPLKTSRSYFYDIRKQFNETQAQAEPKTKEIDNALKKEVAYLRWWKQGEINGWVERLLNEWKRDRID